MGGFVGLLGVFLLLLVWFCFVSFKEVTTEYKNITACCCAGS